MNSSILQIKKAKNVSRHIINMQKLVLALEKDIISNKTKLYNK